MKTNRTILAAAVGLAFCTSASAVNLNPRGLGQVLIYPYYSVNQGQDTLFSMTNAGDVGKVVHVRFHEGYNGRVALDFLVFLSAHDVWTAAISATSDAAGNGAVLRTPDHSCTLPAIPATGLSFTSLDYAGGTGATHPADGGPKTLDRTREGHIEVVSAGDIVPDSATDRRVTHLRSSEPDAAEPAACNELTTSNFDRDLTTPGNTLFGAAGVIKVADGIYYPFNAEALADFTQRPLTNDLAVTNPDGLDHANSGRNDGRVEATLFVDGKPLTLNYERGIDAVSAVFMADALVNDVMLSTTLGAETDWIVTFPTKRYYVDPALEPAAPRKPFSNRFAVPGEAVEQADYRIYDTEQFDMTDPCWEGCLWEPVPLPPLVLPYEVNAIAFQRQPPETPISASAVLGSRLVKALTPSYPGFNSGWAQLRFHASEGLYGGLNGTGAEVALGGFPMTGFMAYNIINANAQPGKLANYSGVFPHRSTASCSPAGTSDTPCN